MFTGIIEQTGTIVSLNDHGGVKRLTVAAPGVADQLREGDSLAISGVCLTALEVDPVYFHADLAAETFARTSLGSLAPGSLVNLELPTQAGAPLGGHIVQGHVDGTGTLVALEPVVDPSSPQFDRDSTDWWLTVRVPDGIRRFMIEKGSVAIEGISLTIASSTAGEGGDTIRIAILPLTYARTNLHTLQPGAPVNVEADVMVKFAAMQSGLDGRSAESESANSDVNDTVAGESFALTESWLIANGY